MHGTPRTEPFNGAIFFSSTDDFFDAAFGPRQHDDHVTARNRHIRLQATLADFDRRNDAVMAHVRVMIERARRV